MDLSKLKPIPQETKEDLLQEESFPDEVTGHCQWKLLSGKRKDETCGLKTFDGSPYCHKHKALLLAKETPLPESPQLKSKSPPKEQKDFEIIPPALLAPPTPNPQPIFQPPPHRQSSPTKALPPSTLTVPDMLSILNIFSQTVIGVAEALKKDPPS